MKMRLIQPNDRIFVAGARGMAGSAIVRALHRGGYGNPAQGGELLTPARKELTLDDGAVSKWMKSKAGRGGTGCRNSRWHCRELQPSADLETDRNTGNRSSLEKWCKAIAIWVVVAFTQNC